MLPSAHLNCVGVLIASFRSSILSSPIPLFTLRCAPHDTQRKTRGRVDRYSFLVRILHSLLHAGLSRRTGMAIFRQVTGWSLASLRIANHPDGSLIRHFPHAGLIGIGAAVTRRPLPHHRAYGSVHGGSSWLIKRTIAPKAMERFKHRIREITRRAKGVSLKTTIAELASYM